PLEAPRNLGRVAASDQDRIEAEPGEAVEDSLQPLAVRGRASARLAPRERERTCLPRLGIGDGEQHSADGRERLLPGRILDDHWNDVPPETAQLDPGLRPRGVDEVGEDEHERARGKARGAADEEVEAALERPRS